jgi:hypothetical protein
VERRDGRPQGDGRVRDIEERLVRQREAAASARAAEKKTFVLVRENGRR